jgi:phospho-N-acetylmuramoyl-pentapeptide-transferase
MIYNLLLPYSDHFHIANLFGYITFRSLLAVLLTLFQCLIFGPRLIVFLKNKQKHGQPIREIGPDHKFKTGTPTMGGLMIVASSITSTFLLADLSNPYILISIFVIFCFCGLGFIDDYAKITMNHHNGLSGKKKFALQSLIALITATLIHLTLPPEHANTLNAPFFKNFIMDLGYFYIPFAMFVIVGSSNAVNLTDGLDGLAIIPICIVAGSLGIISYLSGNHFYANYLQISHIPQVSELTIFCAAILGGGLGFLWFNAQPAEIFMGDTGSLSLGATLGTISLMIKHEIVLAIIGGLFVIETLSVIIQVYYFKATKGKRIFKMAPLHHHFEKGGWPESKIVIRFWIISLIFALIGLSSLKLR